MSDDKIGYEGLVQESLLNVVRLALSKAAKLGALPGKHHFYITFQTQAKGVQLPSFLAEKYPEEITIVIEHQFWDLEVRQDRFSVILQFGGQPKTIVVPFRAITNFYDPSVTFGLRFDAQLNQSGADDSSDQAPGGGDEPMPLAAGAETVQPASGNQVVSLDAFRRK